MKQARAWLRRLAGLDMFSRSAQRDRELAEELDAHMAAEERTFLSRRVLEDAART